MGLERSRLKITVENFYINNNENSGCPKMTVPEFSTLNIKYPMK